VNPSQHTDIKKKRIQTNLERYGVEETLQVKIIREKGKDTMIERYGSEYAMNNVDVKKRRVATNIKRFGVENALQNPDTVAKRKVTNLERYGTEEIFQSSSMKDRIKDTMMERYGTVVPLQCQEIKDKKDKTCEERYGDKDIMHNAEIFEKVMKNSFKKKQYTLPSGTILIYQGYENIAFDELMKEMKESDFTNDVKLMPKFTYQFGGKSHRYYPDLYIPSQKKIIEVKSPYTYNKQLEQNHCKKNQVVQDGYTFEFWICSKEELIERIK
jgi:hypothetical protein